MAHTSETHMFTFMYLGILCSHCNLASPRHSLIVDGAKGSFTLSDASPRVEVELGRASVNSVILVNRFFLVNLITFCLYEEFMD